MPTKIQTGTKLDPNIPPGSLAMGMLERIAKTPVPVIETKQIVVKKLLQFKYIRLEERISPYDTHGGSLLMFMVATPAGLKALQHNRDTRKVSRLMKGGL